LLVFIIIIIIYEYIYIVLEQLIYGEHSLNVNLNLRRKHVAYDSDNPSKLSYEPAIPKDSLTEAQNYLKKAIENGNSEPNSPYTQVNKRKLFFFLLYIIFKKKMINKK